MICHRPLPIKWNKIKWGTFGEFINVGMIIFPNGIEAELVNVEQIHPFGSSEYTLEFKHCSEGITHRKFWKKCYVAYEFLNRRNIKGDIHLSADAHSILSATDKRFDIDYKVEIRFTI